MKLKIKNFNWLAGRPVVILNEKTAERLNVHVDERVYLSNGKKVYAVVDIFSKLVKENEIGLSREISRILRKKTNSLIEVGTAQVSETALLIKKKLAGESLTKAQIE